MSRPHNGADRILRRAAVVTGVGAAGALVPSTAAASERGAIVVPPVDPCDVPLVGAVCGVADGARGVGGDIAAGAADAAIDAFANWMASGISDLLRTVAHALFSGTEVDLLATGRGGDSWFLETYGTMSSIGLAVFAPMLLLAVLHALFSQSGAVLVRALLHLPIAAVGTAAAVILVQALLDITDGFSTAVLSGARSDTEDFLSGIFSALSPSAGEGAVVFGSIFVGLFLALACLVVWVELIVREAAIYLAVMFLPLGFAAYIWPALSGWLRRLVEVIVALVLSKLVIAAALGMAATALAGQEGFAAVVAGTAMFLLAAFSPFVLFKLIPLGEMAAMTALEGQGRKAVSTATPRLSTAYYLQGMRGRFGGSSSAGRSGGSGGSVGSGASPQVGGIPSGAGRAGGAASGGAAAAAGPAAAAVGAAQAARAAGRVGARIAPSTAPVAPSGAAGATGAVDRGGVRP